MKILVAVHAVCASLWLGCVLTEALFERALLPKGADARLTLAALHVRVDKLVEIPAILGVAVSGVLMLGLGRAGGFSFKLMVGAGLVAILANAYCVLLVLNRHAAVVKGDWARFEALDHKQHKFGAIVLVAMLVALGAGYSGSGSA